MNKQISLISSLLFLQPSLVLALYSYIGIFTRLMADDFCTINDAHRFKLLRFIWHWYNNWGGRYSAIATDELLDEIGTFGVRYVPLVVILLWTGASIFMSHQILQRVAQRPVQLLHSTAVGIMLVFATISISPEITKVLFWWNGIRTYIPPFISLSFHVGYLFWATGKFSTNRQILFGCLISFGLALFSGGYNETFTLVQFMGFTSITALFFLFQRTRPKDELFLLLSATTLGALLALLIMIISPGAALRQDIFVTDPLSMNAIFEITVKGYAVYLTQIMLSPIKFTTVVGLISITAFLGIQSREMTLNNKRMMYLFTAGVFFISFASLLPSAYGMGKMPALRTYTVPTFTLVLSMACLGFMLGELISGIQNTEKSRRVSTLLVLCVIAFITLASWGNAKALYDARNIYIEYARLWDSVDAQIKQAKAQGDESITIPNMSGWARLDRPNENPNYWPTACYTELYGIQVYGPSYGP